MEISHFVRSRLKFRHLHILIAIDDTLSVSNAATRLNLSQASVSRTLSEIEDGFGMQIFQRHARGLNRTKAGQELLLAVRRVVENILALDSLTSQVNALEYGEITIGFHSVSLLGRMAQQISRFKALYPNIRIVLRDKLMPELLEDLHYGRLDLVFGRLDPTLEQKGFGTRLLANTKMVIVARSDIARPSKDPKELLSKPWVIPLPGTPMREDFDRYCMENGCAPPSDRIETNNGLLLAEILMQDDRYALFPAELADQSGVHLGLVTFPWMRSYEHPFKSRADRVGMVYAKENVQTPAVEAFLRVANEQADDPDE